MTVMWQLLLLWWAWSPLCLSSSVSFIGTPQQCEQAHFVPGYNLGGEGFDIVTMQRKGAYVINTETWKLDNGTCRMYPNSFMNNKNQKVPVAVVDWRSLPQCSLKVSDLSYDSAESLASDSTSSVTNDWKLDLNMNVDSKQYSSSLGGTHSKESTFAMQKSKEDRYNFIRHSVHCNFYRYRLATNPPLSHEFESAVNSLPAYSSKTEPYRNLIDTYGTHYITQVYLGGEIKAVTALRTCKITMNGLSDTEVKDCLTAEASASFPEGNDMKSMNKYCENEKKKLDSKRSFSSTFSERTTEVIGGNINGADILFEGQSNPSVYTSWLNSLKEIPDIVRYNIKALHTILPSGHKARAGLKQEVEKYIKKNALLKKCSESCQIGQRSSKRDSCTCVCNNNQNVKSNCCPAGIGLATLTVFNLHAKGLYGDKWTQTDGSVEVKYGDQIKRTAIISNNDNPKWIEKFEFGPIVINVYNKLTFNIYDEDTYWNSDLLGKCSFKLHRGNRNEVCALNHGTFFFSYKVECAPSLGGDQCQEYILSPMSASLSKVFYTRNGVLLGETGKQHAKSLRLRPAVNVT